MPIYEFQCEKCGRSSEVLVRSTKWEGTPCPHCGSKKLQKKLYVFASAAGGAAEPAACGLPSKSCGCCCGGRPHSH